MDKRKCMLTLFVLSLTTVLVVYRFGTLSDLDIFSGHESKNGPRLQNETSGQKKVMDEVCYKFSEGACQKCTAKHLDHISECTETGFVRQNSCTFKNSTIAVVYEKCTLTQEDMAQFFIFQAVAMLIGGASIVYVIRRKKQLQEDLQSKVNRMISST